MRRNTVDAFSKRVARLVFRGLGSTAIAEVMKPIQMLLGTLTIMAAFGVPVHVHAQFTFSTNNGAITITGYTGPGGAVSIPDTINGFPVTSVGSSVFERCTNLESVTIPDSVVSVGESVFDFCTKLRTVTLGNSVNKIGYSAFFSCTNLTSIIVDASNSSFTSIDGVLFSKSATILITCPGGKSGSYVVPNGVTTIGDYAFYSCNRLINRGGPQPLDHQTQKLS